MHLKIVLLDGQDLANTGKFIVIGEVRSHKATDLKSSEEIIYHFNRRFPFPRGPVTACVNLKYSTDMSLEFAYLGEYFDWDVSIINCSYHFILLLIISNGLCNHVFANQDSHSSDAFKGIFLGYLVGRSYMYSVSKHLHQIYNMSMSHLIC